MSIAHCITSLAYDEDGATFSRILCENFEFSKLTKTTKMSNSKLEFIQRKFSHQLLKTYHSSDAVDCNPDFMKSALLQRIICRHMGRIWREFKILFDRETRSIAVLEVLKLLLLLGQTLIKKLQKLFLSVIKKSATCKAIFVSKF